MKTFIIAALSSIIMFAPAAEVEAGYPIAAAVKAGTEKYSSTSSVVSSWKASLIAAREETDDATMIFRAAVAAIDSTLPQAKIDLKNARSAAESAEADYKNARASYNAASRAYRAVKDSAYDASARIIRDVREGGASTAEQAKEAINTYLNIDAGDHEEKYLAAKKVYETAEANREKAIQSRRYADGKVQVFYSFTDLNGINFTNNDMLIAHVSYRAARAHID